MNSHTRSKLQFNLISKIIFYLILDKLIILISIMRLKIFNILYLYNIAKRQGTIILNANKKNMPPISPGSIELLINIL